MQTKRPQKLTPLNHKPTVITPPIRNDINAQKVYPKLTPINLAATSNITPNAPAAAQAAQVDHRFAPQQPTITLAAIIKELAQNKESLQQGKFAEYIKRDLAIRKRAGQLNRSILSAIQHEMKKHDTQVRRIVTKKPKNFLEEYMRAAREYDLSLDSKKNPSTPTAAQPPTAQNKPFK